MRWLFPGILVLALLGCGAFAAEDPEQLVRRTTEQLLAGLRAQGPQRDQHPQRVYDLLERVVAPHVNFSQMARWTLGKHWRSATATQRARFEHEFRDLLIRTYAAVVMDYEDETVEYLPTRLQTEDRVEVRTRLHRGGLEPVEIYFLLQRAGDAWKVVDMTIGGVSLVTNYRSTFAEEIQRQGMDGLIRKMEEQHAS